MDGRLEKICLHITGVDQEWGDNSEALYEELEAASHREEQIQKEIDGLKYRIEIVKKI